MAIMSDRVRFAREIAGRTKPRFIDTNPKPKTLEERLALAREIAARTPARFIEIPRERGGGKIHYTEEQLTAVADSRLSSIAGRRSISGQALSWLSQHGKTVVPSASRRNRKNLGSKDKEPRADHPALFSEPRIR
jgi:hypothetical protein